MKLKFIKNKAYYAYLFFNDFTNKIHCNFVWFFVLGVLGFWGIQV